jgi:radical SAM superfamily enzyme YgiQ (UPF0313 family)
MKILLINFDLATPPLSPVRLLYLSAHLKSKGFPVEVIDLVTATDRENALAKIGDIVPGLINFSIPNIDSLPKRDSQYFLPEAMAIARRIKALYPEIPLVLGGAGFSIAPEDMIESSGADFGVVGEGEFSLEVLARILDGGHGGPAFVPGLVWRNSAGRLTLNPCTPMNGDTLSKLPFQDLSAVDYNYYFQQGGMAGLQTKRGCSLQCNYCTSPGIEGKQYRLFSPQRVVDEMEHMVSLGYDYFHFTDSVFNVPRTHAMNVCREIAARKLKVRWHAYMSPSGFDDHVADLLAESGNDGILFGVDTCSAAMLTRMGKAFTRDDIYRAADACQKKELEFSFHILFGSPGETLETVQETFRTLDEIRPTAAFLTQGLRVYRRTPLHVELVKAGVLRGDEPLLEPYFYMSPELPADFSDVVHRYAVERDFVFSDTTIKSPSTNADVVELYKRGFRGPCWKVLRELKNSESRA